MNLPISIRLSVVIVLAVVFAGGSVSVLAYTTTSDAMIRNELMHIEDEARVAEIRLQTRVSRIRDDVQFLAALPAVRDLIAAYRQGADPETMAAARELAKDAFEAFVVTHPEYRQARIIGVADGGRELVNIRRVGASVVRVADADLQRKSEREFFVETATLRPGEFFLSPIDLTHDQGKIETPHVPALRGGCPLFAADGTIFGIVLVNFNIREVFESLADALPSRFELRIVNSAGDYLFYSTHPEKTFGFDLGATHRIQAEIPALADAVRTAGSIADFPARHVGDDTVLHVRRVSLHSEMPQHVVGMAVVASYADVLADALAMRDRAIWLTFGLIAVASVIAVGFARLITSPLHRIAHAIEMFAKNRTADAPLPVDRQDELGALARSVRDMRDTICRQETERENLLATIAATARQLTHAAHEISAATAQQTAGAQEQAVSAAQTLGTITDVLRTMSQAAERAKGVAASAEQTVNVGTQGRQSVEKTVRVMDTVKARVEQIAGHISTLADQAQAIGEIIATVTEIAEQTNLLALNAAIEASRAGIHGKGFAVVAGEVKALAGQSKDATKQIRQILGDIQTATQRTVIAMEQGTHDVNGAINVVNEAGASIGQLLDSIHHAATAATQISASASQQAAGMAQIQQAMASIDTATTQSLASTRQTEQAARELSELAVTLRQLLDPHAPSVSTATTTVAGPPTGHR